MFSREVLAFDAPQVARDIEEAVRRQAQAFRRRGAVLGVSGGIDSAVVVTLCTRALGKERVLALFLPERDSADESEQYGRKLTDALGIEARTENIAGILAAAGCYDRQTEAIRKVFPEYGEGYKNKIVLPSILKNDRLNISELTIESPSGEQKTARLPLDAYLQLVAATNFKQRVRKMMEYYHADRLNYLVAATPNRLEYDQGFFVKVGDGAGDIKPIAHLYKSQVYALAAFLGVPKEILSRQPTTDTFSLAQSQEEFYFALPYEKMDLCLYGLNHGVPPAEVGPAIGLTAEQVERVYRDIEQKRRTTRYLHHKPVLAVPVPEIEV
jgi:NAD+ synthase